MKPVLTYISALEFWRLARMEGNIYKPLNSPCSALNDPPTLDSFGNMIAWWLKRPLHVLVRDRNTCRTSQKVVSHAWQGELPRGAILDTGQGFCVCSPEMLFVDMARTMEIAQLIEFGCELCGTYDVSRGTYRTCEPLTSIKKLKNFAQNAKGMRGRTAALRAVKYLVEKSASPRETDLVLLLCLPYSMGGYNLPAPKLNYRIDLSDKTRTSAGKRYYLCDLYWPEAKLAVEYDSDEFHAQNDRISRDAIRRTVLEERGIKVITITNDQIKSRIAFNVPAKAIASQLGKRLRNKDQKSVDACYQLREQLIETR